jgi:hypothetical protein
MIQTGRGIIPECLLPVAREALVTGYPFGLCGSDARLDTPSWLFARAVFLVALPASHCL